MSREFLSYFIWGAHWSILLYFGLAQRNVRFWTRRSVTALVLSVRASIFSSLCQRSPLYAGKVSLFNAIYSDNFNFNKEFFIENFWLILPVLNSSTSFGLVLAVLTSFGSFTSFGKWKIFWNSFTKFRLRQFRKLLSFG